MHQKNQQRGFPSKSVGPGREAARLLAVSAGLLLARSCARASTG
jgi:hypothetical protein